MLNIYCWQDFNIAEALCEIAATQNIQGLKLDILCPTSLILMNSTILID